MEQTLFSRFRRPLVLCHLKGESDLSSVGFFDGVYFEPAPDGGDLEACLRNLAPHLFVYLTLGAPLPCPLDALTAMLRRTRSPNETVVCAPDPEVLRALWQTGGDCLPRLAYRLSEQGSDDIWAPCPYDGIELPLAMATAERIRRIHAQGKEVYMAMSSSTRSARQWRRRRGLPWLAHEKVEIVLET